MSCVVSVSLRVALAILLTFGSVGRAAAQSAERCFAETGFCMGSEIRAYWERNGGLSVFGLPITESRSEVNREDNNSYETQWLERNRFELHPVIPENGSVSYQVLLGRLGDDRLRQQGRDWQAFPKADPQAPNYFAETGHAIAPEFADYWRTHGLDLGEPGVSFRESLALFGYPLSDPQPEEVAPGVTVLTQWYERARFEYHPNNPTPYKVLLGRLGAELRETAARTARGGTLVYTTGGGSNELYTINADLSGQTWLRVDSQLGPRALVGSPAWSPDGQQIAFTGRAEGDQVGGIYIINRDGSGLRRIAAGGGQVTWSPDGKRIAYLIYHDEQSDIYAVNSDGSGQTQLTDTPEYEDQITWSPDGGLIALTFQKPNSPEWRLGVVAAGGGPVTPLPPALGRDPSWAPDGRRLAFTDISENMRRVAVLNLDTGEVRRLVEGVQPVWGPPAAPEKIAFYGLHNAPESGIIVINSDGSGATGIGSGSGRPSWSPDGRFLAVSSDIRVGYMVTILAADGSAPPRDIARGSGAQWAPR